MIFFQDGQNMTPTPWILTRYDILQISYFWVQLHKTIELMMFFHSNWVVLLKTNQSGKLKPQFLLNMARKWLKRGILQKMQLQVLIERFLAYFSKIMWKITSKTVWIKAVLCFIMILTLEMIANQIEASRQGEEPRQTLKSSKVVSVWERVNEKKIFFPKMRNNAFWGSKWWNMALKWLKTPFLRKNLTFHILPINPFPHRDFAEIAPISKCK